MRLWLRGGRIMALIGRGGTPKGDPGGELAMPRCVVRLSSARGAGGRVDAGAAAAAVAKGLYAPRVVMINGQR